MLMHQFGSAHRYKFEFPKGTISIWMLGRGREGKVDELGRQRYQFWLYRKVFSHSKPYLWEWVTRDRGVVAGQIRERKGHVAYPRLQDGTHSSCGCFA